VVPQTQIDLAEWLPSEAVHVAESGIQSAADLARMHGAGYDAFLVGESLMRQPDPAAALAKLLAT
jgi:indole-3-glycerol phosphate synthase